MRSLGAVASTRCRVSASVAICDLIGRAFPPGSVNRNEEHDRRPARVTCFVFWHAALFSLSRSLRFLDFSRQTLQRSGFRLVLYLDVMLQRNFAFRSVAENFADKV